MSVREGGGAAMEVTKWVQGSVVQSFLRSEQCRQASCSGSTSGPSFSGRGLSSRWSHCNGVASAASNIDNLAGRRAEEDLWVRTVAKKKRVSFRMASRVLGLGDQPPSTLDPESRVEVQHKLQFPSSPAVGSSRRESATQIGLPSDLRPELMPKHVAIIMDGNSRWAKRRGMKAGFGHAAGAEVLQKVAKVASSWGIQVLTVFAFSTENWLRPQMEVEFLMHLFETKLETEMPNIMTHKFRLRFIGDTATLPLTLQKAVEMAEEATKCNPGMIINICVSYSGRADIVRACQELAAQVAEGSLNPADIDDATLTRTLFMNELGVLQEPDLLIRTSGEQRISNFMLWQLAYSELIFLDTLWPDFETEDFKDALVTYQRRDRRFGKRIV